LVKKREETVMARLAVLPVGESTSLGFFKGRIGYGGMPNDQTFTLGLRSWNFGQMAWGWNPYFPADQKQAYIEGVDIQVEEVTPSEIRLRIG